MNCEDCGIIIENPKKNQFLCPDCAYNRNLTNAKNRSKQANRIIALEKTVKILEEEIRYCKQRIKELEKRNGSNPL